MGRLAEGSMNVVGYVAYLDYVGHDVKAISMGAVCTYCRDWQRFRERLESRAAGASSRLQQRDGLAGDGQLFVGGDNGNRDRRAVGRDHPRILGAYGVALSVHLEAKALE